MAIRVLTRSPVFLFELEVGLSLVLPEYLNSQESQSKAADHNYDHGQSQYSDSQQVQCLIVIFPSCAGATSISTFVSYCVQFALCGHYEAIFPLLLFL